MEIILTRQFKDDIKFLHLKNCGQDILSETNWKDLPFPQTRRFTKFAFQILRLMSANPADSDFCITST